MKHEPMTQERLDAIQARVDGATGGPWGCYGDGAHEVFDAGEYSDGDRGEVVAAVIDKLSDAVFIAEAREDIPALLAEVERLRALITVDEDMVERAAETLYVHDFLRWNSWATEGRARVSLEAAKSGQLGGWEAALEDARVALHAALNPGEGS